VRTCWLHKMVNVPLWLASNDFGTWSYECLLSILPPISLNMFKCSWAHTHYHVYLLFFCQYWACWCDVFFSLIKLFTDSAFDMFLFVVFLSHDIYVVCNVQSCAVVISLSVCPFRSPLGSHGNVSAPPISFLSILLIYWPCITLLSHFFFKDFPNFAFMCWMPSNLCHCSHLIGLIRL